MASQKELKAQLKAEKKALKRSKKANKKERKMEKKMRKVQKKTDKLKAKLERSGVKVEETQTEAETAPEETDDVPEFIVVSDEDVVETSMPDIDTGDVDTSRLKEIERKMDVAMGQETGLRKLYKERYGEELPMHVRSGSDEDEEAETPSLAGSEEKLSEVLGEKKEEVKTEEAAKPKKEKKAAPSGGFLDIKNIFFLRDSKDPDNKIVRLIMTIIDIPLWIVRFIIFIPVTILRKIKAIIGGRGKKSEAAS